jgi:hypothetical protein
MSFSSLVPRCGIILFACRKSIMAVFILTAFASLANAQVILPAPQETISVSGGGALSYSVRSTKFPCGNSFPVGGIPPGNYILQNVYQNFVYTDVYGAQNTESATLSYTQGIGCTAAAPPTVQLTGGNWGVSFTPLRAGYSGTATLKTLTAMLVPKYLVLGVYYAPPGAKSTTTYTNTSTQGESTSISNSFTNATSTSAAIGASLGITGFSASATLTASNSYTQEADTSSSYAVNTTTSNVNVIPGPASSTIGIDHDYDKILIWLNPELDMSINTDNSLSWHGYSYNPEDPVEAMDVIQLPVLWLKNPGLIPADVNAVLARSWDTTGQGPLNQTDFETIMARDPLVNPTFNPNLDTTGRFQMATGQTFDYVPTPAGGQPNTEQFSVNYQATNTAGRGSSDTYQTGMTVDVKFTSSIAVVKITDEFKETQTATLVNKWSTLSTQTSGQTAAFSIVGPLSTDNYTGPVSMQIWKDNVYGTFMFYPIQ